MEFRLFGWEVNIGNFGSTESLPRERNNVITIMRVSLVNPRRAVLFKRGEQAIAELRLYPDNLTSCECGTSTLVSDRRRAPVNAHLRTLFYI